MTCKEDLLTRPVASRLYVVEVVPAGEGAMMDTVPHRLSGCCGREGVPPMAAQSTMPRMPSEVPGLGVGELGPAVSRETAPSLVDDAGE